MGDGVSEEGKCGCFADGSHHWTLQQWKNAVQCNIADAGLSAPFTAPSRQSLS